MHLKKSAIEIHETHSGLKENSFEIVNEALHLKKVCVKGIMFPLFGFIEREEYCGKQYCR